VADLRRDVAILTSKALTRGIRLTGRGGGTALPGAVALKVDPRLLEKLTVSLPMGSVVVAGTNGKTTTSRIIASMFQETGWRVAHNRSGSNLARGVTAALAEHHAPRGKQADLAVIECDENAFPEIVRAVRPRLVLLLNLFRDQLDRYGELETISLHWRPVIAQLPPETTLAVNADDPRLEELASQTPAKVVRFGLGIETGRLAELPHAADAAYCRVCGARLEYRTVYLAHLGDYVCPACGNQRAPLDVEAVAVEQRGFAGQRISIRSNESPELLVVETSLPGLYNAYNIVAAVTAGQVFGVDPAVIRNTLAGFRPAFGRLEEVVYRGVTMTLALAKNPVGFNELIRTLADADRFDLLVIAINDLDADGRDVSWLWDVDFEGLAGDRVPRLIAAGLRGADLAVRMKYAGYPADRLDDSLAGRPLGELPDALVSRMPDGGRVFILLTYTALLHLRQALTKRGAVLPFWEQ
jgi:UDP-N-acetylmuramyl tripeptide synthase